MKFTLVDVQSKQIWFLGILNVKRVIFMVVLEILQENLSNYSVLKIPKTLNENLLTMSTMEFSTILKIIENQISCCPIKPMMVPRHIKCQRSHIHGWFGNITTEPFKLFSPQNTQNIERKIVNYERHGVFDNL